jgi:hypothetical protein
VNDAVRRHSHRRTDVAAYLIEIAVTTDRIERGIQESKRPAGVVIEVGNDACPLRRAFAGAADEATRRTQMRFSVPTGSLRPKSQSRKFSDRG